MFLCKEFNSTFRTDSKRDSFYCSYQKYVANGKLYAQFYGYCAPVLGIFITKG